jgi:hypothetical protein
LFFTCGAPQQLCRKVRERNANQGSEAGDTKQIQPKSVLRRSSLPEL